MATAYIDDTLAQQAASPLPSSSPFPFPREYHFPPFFTAQTNLTTRHAQLVKWSALVLAYARHHRLFRLSASAAAETDLFRNPRIDRRLPPADIKELLDFMRRDGRAESVSGSSDVVYLYWRKPAEWADVIEAYVDSTAQKGAVFTVYELAQGEGTRGTELHGIDTDVLMKALNVLVKKGKAQIFGQDDSQGVKFF